MGALPDAVGPQQSEVGVPSVSPWLSMSVGEMKVA
jgi:hypothetical protein